MIFSELYKSPRSPLARLRHNNTSLSGASPPPSPSPTIAPATVAAEAMAAPTAVPAWADDEYADLLSKDKTKQKDAVKRYLSAQVKNDWDFVWDESTAARVQLPKGEVAKTSDDEAVVEDKTQEDQGYQVDDTDSDDDDNESVYSVMSEDNARFRARTEWTSDFSDDEDSVPFSPFRFDHSESAVSNLHLAELTKRARRRKQVRKEMEWNQGLACFETRRNAWTGAKTVRVRSKPGVPPLLSPKSPRRFFFRRSMSGSPPSAYALHQVESATTSDASSAKDDRELKKNLSNGSAPPDPRTYPVETLIPLAQPILPPSNPLRASITPSVYLSLYDKVILHNLQPSCPINLGDMLRACVTGWKRDGEWPPKPAPYDAGMSRKKPKTPSTPGEKDNSRRLSFGILGREKEKDDGSPASKGFRRSLQRAFGLGPIPGVDAT